MERTHHGLSLSVLDMPVPLTQGEAVLRLLRHGGLLPVDVDDGVRFSDASPTVVLAPGLSHPPAGGLGCFALPGDRVDILGRRLPGLIALWSVAGDLEGPDDTHGVSIPHCVAEVRFELTIPGL